MPRAPLVGSSSVSWKRAQTTARSSGARSRRTRSTAMEPTTTLAHPLAALGEQAKVYLDASRAASTRRAYASAWAAFTAWCDGHQLASLPAAPETLALY